MAVCLQHIFRPHIIHTTNTLCLETADGEGEACGHRGYVIPRLAVSIALYVHIDEILTNDVIRVCIISVIRIVNVTRIHEDETCEMDNTIILAPC